MFYRTDFVIVVAAAARNEAEFKPEDMIKYSFNCDGQTQQRANWIDWIAVEIELRVAVICHFLCL